MATKMELKPLYSKKKNQNIIYLNFNELKLQYEVKSY